MYSNLCLYNVWLYIVTSVRGFLQGYTGSIGIRGFCSSVSVDVTFGVCGVFGSGVFGESFRVLISYKSMLNFMSDIN